MKKIGIIVREETSFKCSGGGCLKAFFHRVDQFEGYPIETELLAMTHSGGNIAKKIERMRKNGITRIHLSTCLSKYPEEVEELLPLLDGFEIVYGTHGRKNKG